MNLLAVTMLAAWAELSTRILSRLANTGFRHHHHHETYRLSFHCIDQFSFTLPLLSFLLLLLLLLLLPPPPLQLLALSIFSAIHRQKNLVTPTPDPMLLLACLFYLA